jgi:hypothetical protein
MEHYASRLLNVHKISDAWQMHIHRAEPLLPEPSPHETEISVPKLRKYKSPDSDQIPAELIQAAGKILRYEIHKIINCIWNKDEIPHQ